MRESQDYSFKQDRVTGSLHTLRSRDGEVYGQAGAIATPSGIVEVYLSEWESGPRAGYQSVFFEAVVDGRAHRHWEERPPSRKLTETGAKTVAHRWIRQIVADPKA